MFTGLIDDVGVLQSVKAAEAGRELTIGCRHDDLQSGESVAVNGVCLTVRESGAGWFSAAAAEPTVQRTAIGSWEEGLRVNLERGLRVGDRLGGHVVQGHVDAVGRVLAARMSGDVLLIDIALPAEVRDLVVLHGSVAVDGVSLTVNALPSADVLQVAVIEFTVRHTTLGELRTGSPVHLEADVLGRYVKQFLRPYLPQP